MSNKNNLNFYRSDIMKYIPNIKDYKKTFVSSRNENKQNLKKWINSTFISMVSLIAGLFIYYIFTLNIHATAWYKIREIEEKINDLSHKNDTISAKIFKLSSLSNIIKNKDIKKHIEKENEHKILVIKEWVQYVFNN